ncbi:MAG: hypothetical protein J6X78_06070 [Treponema sp.]|nr:hypothetical protein [Treponema sp.]
MDFIVDIFVRHKLDYADARIRAFWLRKKTYSGARSFLYCNKETVLTTKTKEELDAFKKSLNMKILITVIIVIAIFVIFCTTIFISVGIAFKNFIPYKHSIELVENNQTIKDFL